MTMPHNLAVEAAVIGAVLYDNGTFERVRDTISAEDFYAPAHRAIFTLISDTIASGRIADGVTLREAVTGTEKVAEIGGTNYLMDLLESAAFGAEVADYCRMISDLSRRRDMIRAAEDLKIAAIGGGGEWVNPAEVLAQAGATISGLAQRCGTQNNWATLPDTSVSLLSNVAQSLLDGKPRGLATGINRLDQFMGGMRAGDLVIIAGASSMGKTSVSRNVAYSVARSGKNVAFFSLEMTAEQLAERTLSAEARRLGYSRVPYRDMNNATVSGDDLESLKETAERLSGRLVVDDTPGVTVTDIRLRSRLAERKLGSLDLIVIDYLQIMEIPQHQGDNRTVAIGRTTKALKAMAKEFGCPVIVLSQLSRAYFSREGKRPQLVDLRESGSIEQDADKVMFVHREAYFIERNEPAWSDVNAHNEWRAELRAVENRLEIIVAKNRMGRVGTVELWIDQACDLVLSDSSELQSGEVIPMRGAKE